MIEDLMNFSRSHNYYFSYYISLFFNHNQNIHMERKPTDDEWLLMLGARPIFLILNLYWF